MTKDEIIAMAKEAGFNWPEILTTTIEERLERFYNLAYTKGAQLGKRPVFADYLAHRAAARAIESAVHQQYAEWLEKQEPVAWQHQKPIVDNHGQLLGYSEWKDGKGGLSFWPHRKLFIHPSRDTGLLEQVRDFILARSEHAQECDVFDLDDNGRHKACSCGLAELVTTLHERLEQQT